jgi:hypothetical protein
MTRKPKPGREDSGREDRLKAALKANLARRKAQARVRGAAAGGENGTSGKKD